MNFYKYTALLFATVVVAQNDGSDQNSGQIANASSVISSDVQGIQATISSFAVANSISTLVPESAKQHASEQHADRKQGRQGRRASASQLQADQGVGTVPSEAGQSYLSSVQQAAATKFHEARSSYSGFMATQTNINTSSLVADFASYTATASVKPNMQSRKNKRKEAKSKASEYKVTNTATPTGLSKGFKNFFKSIQMKIQKTSTLTITPTAS